jgi:hypothetical protein
MEEFGRPVRVSALTRTPEQKSAGAKIVADFKLAA